MVTGLPREEFLLHVTRINRMDRIRNWIMMVAIFGNPAHFLLMQAEQRQVVGAKWGTVITVLSVISAVLADW